jgi:hypothetical protein
MDTKPDTEFIPFLAEKKALSKEIVFLDELGGVASSAQEVAILKSPDHSCAADR